MIAMVSLHGGKDFAAINSVKMHQIIILSDFVQILLVSAHPL